jgi:FtsP/CotA-like multicopper oxidase with cupredoxin domain
MSAPANRRDFLKRGSLAAAGLLATAATASAQAASQVEPAPEHAPHPPHADPAVPAHIKAEYEGFSRFHPGRGNDPDSPYYLGKLVPGFRKAEDGPAPFVAPDLDKLPYVMKDGVKEFHLVPQPVVREFLPGYKMNVWGFNGSMPGPTIEVTQGDRIRIVVTNELPEETTVHWHGFELPVQYDGSSTMTQNPIKPGQTFVYEFNVHEEGTFFYHTHVAMQEAFGMIGWMIVHPKKVFDPPVDRDFGLLFQNFFIGPNQTVADSMKMDWNWHTINGRSGPYSTPLVCKHGERVRVRLINFSPMQHHPIHMHGHTFWITAHEGARTPKSAWIPRNTELVAVAQASTFEFIANNPGDWMFHCHMTHHMMNHMVEQVGPRIRHDDSVDRFLANLETRPPAIVSPTAKGDEPPGYPQKMLGMHMSPESMQQIMAPREMKGMRQGVSMSMHGLMTAMRVLPDDLYHRVMETDEDIPPGEIFAEIVKRFGDPEHYQRAPKMMTHDKHGH